MLRVPREANPAVRRTDAVRVVSPDGEASAVREESDTHRLAAAAVDATTTRCECWRAPIREHASHTLPWMLLLSSDALSTIFEELDETVTVSMDKTDELLAILAPAVTIRDNERDTAGGKTSEVTEV